MREITSHHDGHGLNESLRILADETDQNSGGASHNYTVLVGDDEICRVQFQHGPRNVEGSTPGATEAVLLAILADRMDCFNKGPYSCRENAIVLTKLQEALHWMRHRADERAKRGVLGQNKK